MFCSTASTLVVARSSSVNLMTGTHQHNQNSSRFYHRLVKRLSRHLTTTTSTTVTSSSSSSIIHMKTAADLVPGLVAGRSQLFSTMSMTMASSLSSSSSSNSSLLLSGSRDTTNHDDDQRHQNNNNMNNNDALPSLLDDLNITITKLCLTALRQSLEPSMLSRELDRFLPVLELLPLLKEMLDRAERRVFFAKQDSSSQITISPETSWETFVVENVNNEELSKFAENFLTFAAARPNPELSLHCLRLLHKLAPLHHSYVSLTLFPHIISSSAAVYNTNNINNTITTTSSSSSFRSSSQHPLLRNEVFLSHFREVLSRGNRAFSLQPYNKRILIGQLFSSLVCADSTSQGYYLSLMNHMLTIGGGTSTPNTNNTNNSIISSSESNVATTSAEEADQQRSSTNDDDASASSSSATTTQQHYSSLFELTTSSNRSAPGSNRRNNNILSSSTKTTTNPLTTSNAYFSFNQTFDLWVKMYPLSSSSSSSQLVDLEAELSILSKRSMMTLSMIKNNMMYHHHHRDETSNNKDGSTSKTNDDPSTTTTTTSSSPVIKISDETNNDLNNDLVWNQKPPSNYILGLLMFLNEAKSLEDVLKFFRFQLEKRGFGHVLYLDESEAEKALLVREESKKKLIEREKEKLDELKKQKKMMNSNSTKTSDKHDEKNIMIKVKENQLINNNQVTFFLPDFQIRAAVILTLRIARLIKTLPHHQNQRSSPSSRFGQQTSSSSLNNNNNNRVSTANAPQENNSAIINNNLDNNDDEAIIDEDVVEVVNIDNNETTIGIPDGKTKNNNNRSNSGAATTTTTTTTTTSSSYELVQGTVDAEIIASMMSLWIDYFKAMITVDKQQHARDIEMAKEESSDENKDKDKEKEQKSSSSTKTTSTTKKTPLVKQFLQEIQPKTFFNLLKVLRFYSMANSNTIKNTALLQPLQYRFEEVLKYCIRHYSSDFVDIVDIACFYFGGGAPMTTNSPFSSKVGLKFLSHGDFVALFDALEKFARAVTTTTTTTSSTQQKQTEDESNNNEKKQHTSSSSSATAAAGESTSLKTTSVASPPLLLSFEEKKRAHLMFRKSYILRFLSKSLEYKLFSLQPYEDGVSDFRQRLVSSHFVEKMLLSSSSALSSSKLEEKGESVEDTTTANDANNNNNNNNNNEEVTNTTTTTTIMPLDEAMIHVEESKRLRRITERREKLHTIMTAISDQVLQVPQLQQQADRMEKDNKRRQRQQQHDDSSSSEIQHQLQQSSQQFFAIRNEQELIRWLRVFVELEFDHVQLNYALTTEILRFLKRDDTIPLNVMNDNSNNNNSESTSTTTYFSTILEAPISTILFKHSGLIMRVLGLGMSSSSDSSPLSNNTVDNNNKTSSTTTLSVPSSSIIDLSQSKIDEVTHQCYELLLAKMKSLFVIKRRYSFHLKNVISANSSSNRMTMKQTTTATTAATDEQQSQTEQQQQEDDDDDDILTITDHTLALEDETTALNHQQASPTQLISSSMSPSSSSNLLSPREIAELKEKRKLAPKFTLLCMTEFLHGHHLANRPIPKEFRIKFIVPNIVRTIAKGHRNTYNTIGREFATTKAKRKVIIAPPASSSSPIPSSSSSDIIVIPHSMDLLLFSEIIIAVVTTGFLTALTKLPALAVISTLRKSDFHRKNDEQSSSSSSSSSRHHDDFGIGISTELTITNVYKTLCFAITYLFKRDPSDMNVDKISLLHNAIALNHQYHSSNTDSSSSSSSSSSLAMLPLSMQPASLILKKSITIHQTPAAAAAAAAAAAGGGTNNNNNKQYLKQFNSLFSQQIKISTKLLYQIAVRMTYTSFHLRKLRMKMENSIGNYIQLSVQEVLKTRMDLLVEQEENRIKKSNNNDDDPSSNHHHQNYHHHHHHTHHHQNTKQQDLLQIQQQPQLAAARMLTQVCIRLTHEIDTNHESRSRWSITQAKSDRYSRAAFTEERAQIYEADHSIDGLGMMMMMKNNNNKNSNNKNTSSKKDKDDAGIEEADDSKKNVDNSTNNQSDEQQPITGKPTSTTTASSLPRHSQPRHSSSSNHRPFFMHLHPLRIRCALMTLNAVITMKPAQVSSTSPSSSSLLISNLWNQSFIQKHFSLSSLSLLASLNNNNNNNLMMFSSSSSFNSNKHDNNKFFSSNNSKDNKQLLGQIELGHRIVYVFLKNMMNMDRFGSIAPSPKTNNNNNNAKQEEKSEEQEENKTADKDESTNNTNKLSPSDDDDEKESSTNKQSTRQPPLSLFGSNQHQRQAALLLPNMKQLLSTTIEILENSPLYRVSTDDGKNAFRENTDNDTQSKESSSSTTTTWKEEREETEKNTIAKNNKHDDDDDVDTTTGTDEIDDLVEGATDDDDTETTILVNKKLLSSPSSSSNMLIPTSKVQITTQMANHIIHLYLSSGEEEDYWNSSSSQSPPPSSSKFKSRLVGHVEKAFDKKMLALSSSSSSSSLSKNKKAPSSEVKMEMKLLKKEKEQLLEMIDQVDEMIQPPKH